MLCASVCAKSRIFSPPGYASTSPVSKGEINSGIVLGCEALYSFTQATRKLEISVREGEDGLGWGEAEVGDQERLRRIKATCAGGEPRAFGPPLGSVIYTEQMRAHGIAVPSAVSIGCDGEEGETGEVAEGAGAGA